MEYTPIDSFARQSAPKFSFNGGGAQRPLTTESYMQSPGPGHYPSKALISGGHKRGGVIGEKNKLKMHEPGSNNVPGPGAYQIDISPVKNKEPTWRIGTARRDEEDRIMRKTQNFPAPTAYNPNYGFSTGSEPKWGFGSSQRKPLQDGKVCSPSMQAYNIPSKAIEGRQQHMGLKLAIGGTMPTKASDIPGPGAYNPKFIAQAKDCPKYSIKGRYADRRRDNIPAPGTYESGFADKQKAPAFGFGSSPQRVPLNGKAHDSPGPGNYKVPAFIATKNSYIQSSLDEKF